MLCYFRFRKGNITLLWVLMCWVSGLNSIYWWPSLVYVFVFYEYLGYSWNSVIVTLNGFSMRTHTHTHGYPSCLCHTIYRPALSGCCLSKLNIALLHDFTLCLFSPSLSYRQKHTPNALFFPRCIPLLCTGCKRLAPLTPPTHLFTSPPSYNALLTDLSTSGVRK